MNAKSLSTALAMVLSGTMITAPVYAENTYGQPDETVEQTQMNAGSFIQTQREQQVRADELIGATVIGPSGEPVGKITDLVLDPQNRLTGAVVGVGGFLGIGEKEVAVPWDELEIGAQDAQREKVEITLSRTRAELEQAPHFRTRQEVQRLEALEAAQEAHAAAVANPQLQAALQATEEAQMAVESGNEQAALNALSRVRAVLEQVTFPLANVGATGPSISANDGTEVDLQ